MTYSPRSIIKHLIIITFFLGLTPSYSLAVPSKSDQALVPHPFFWEVSGPNGAQAYLMGTMHIPDPRWEGLPKSLLEKLDGADEVYGELDMQDKTAMSSQVMQRALLKDGQSLRKIIGDDLYMKLDAYLSKRGQRAIMMSSFHPKMVEVMVSSLELFKLMQSGKPVLDEWLLKRAASKGKKTGGIETITEQLDALFNGTMDEAKESLRFTLNQLIAKAKKGIKPFDQLVAVYFSGDEDKINAFMKDELDGAPPALLKSMNQLLHKRNQVMADRVMRMIKQSPQKKYFFAFGVAHLVGQDSVVARLRAKGFTVKRRFAP